MSGNLWDKSVPWKDWIFADSIKRAEQVYDHISKRKQTSEIDTYEQQERCHRAMVSKILALAFCHGYSVHQYLIIASKRISCISECSKTQSQKGWRKRVVLGKLQEGCQQLWCNAHVFNEGVCYQIIRSRIQWTIRVELEDSVTLLDSRAVALGDFDLHTMPNYLGLQPLKKIPELIDYQARFIADTGTQYSSNLSIICSPTPSLWL